MAKKKILIVSMKAGWGHIKAAQALEEYAKANLPELYVKHVDLCVIEPLIGKFFQKFTIFPVTDSRACGVKSTRLLTRSWWRSHSRN